MIRLRIFGFCWWWFYLVVSGMPLLLCSTNNEKHVHHQIVETDSGRIRGAIVHTDVGSNVVQFLGIPYGEAPINDNRFKLPKEVKPWAKTLHADHLALACYQWRDNTFSKFNGSEMWNANTNMSEDCLNMNIWVPKGARNAAVLVWIYGGGFIYGSPSLDLYNGEILAAEGRVVVVNINYRVSAFGFLYLDDDIDSAPGNMGLADQQLALRWIKRNIAKFGGDPNKITLFGESAGAASVSSHMLSENSWDLFRYVILQSGAINEPWALKTPSEAKARSMILAEQLNCSRRTSNEIAQCLRSVSPVKLQKAVEELSVGFIEFPFVPISHDVHFFNGDVHDKLRSGNFKKTTVLMGSNSDEGSFWLPYYLNEYFNSTSDGLIDKRAYVHSVNKAFQNLSPIIRNSVAFHYEVDSPSSPETLRLFSRSQHSSATVYRDLISKSVGDYYFTCRVLEMADLLSSKGSVVYMYYFVERSTVNPWPKWMGVMHGYEIEYIFGAPLRKFQVYTPQEIDFSRHIIRYWANFAETGVPTTTLSKEKTPWQIYGHEKRFFTLGSNAFTEGTVFNKKDCKFWKQVEQLCTNARSAVPISQGPKLQNNSLWMFAIILILIITC